MCSRLIISPAEAVLPPALLMDTVYVQTNGDRIVYFVTECLHGFWHTPKLKYSKS